MAKTWTTRRRGDEKDFLSSLRKGMTVYVVNEHSTKIAAQFRTHSYSEHKVTGKHPILGGWQIGNNIDARGFFRAYGTVYDTPPPGLRHISDDGDASYAPFGPGDAYDRPLDSQEIKEMEERAYEASERRNGALKAGARKWF